MGFIVDCICKPLEKNGYKYVQWIGSVFGMYFLYIYIFFLFISFKKIFSYIFIYNI